MHGFKGYDLIAGARLPNRSGAAVPRQYCASGTMTWLLKNRFIAGEGPGKLFRVAFATRPTGTRDRL
jgi:hypothetical protein